MSQPPTSSDVRIWSIDKYSGARGTTYRLRWRVHGKRHSRSFTTKKLADAFRAQLLIASTGGLPFDTASGLPPTLSTAPPKPPTTWLQVAIAYAETKWTRASARHRKGIAEALTTVSMELLTEAPSDITPKALRHALKSHAFNFSDRADTKAEVATALAWLHSHSLPIERLTEPAVARRALTAISTTLEGKDAAASTTARKRATLSNALLYAVENGHLEANPLRDIRAPRTYGSHAVDRRVVVNPDQARDLIDAVHDGHPALAAFFGAIYFAALRPSEAHDLRHPDLHLPRTGWGEAIVARSRQHAGSVWTTNGKRDEVRGLKHRHPDAERPVPLPPELVAIFRRHLDRFPTAPDGRLFVARTGRAGVPLSAPYLTAVSPNTIYRAWHQARQKALSDAQFASDLARRPYDLRHACVSTWLNAGVPPAQVAEWAGHSVGVLLSVYAKCIDGQDDKARQQIEAALGTPSTFGPDQEA